MANTEYIRWLKLLDDELTFDALVDGKDEMDMHEMIWELCEKLEQEKTGHWILDETDNSITCDKCGCLIWANDISNGEAYYCPNCGARMEG